MKKILLLLVLVLFSAPAFAQRTGLGIAATVNSDIITSSDVAGRYAMAMQSAKMQPDAAAQKALLRQALDSLIDEQIRLQEALKQGVTPSPEEVNDSFAKVAAQNNASPEDFRAAINQTPGVYESVMRQLKTQLAWANVVRKKIRPQVTVSESDITTYLTEQAKNPAKIEYLIAEIFLKNNDANKQLARQLIQELKGGQRFSTLARQFSQGLEASKGGLLGWIPENRLETALDIAIKATAIGTVSEPVISTRGIHILMVLEKRDVMQAKQSSQRLGIKQIMIPLPPEVSDDINAQALQQADFLRGEAKDCAAMDEVIKKVNSPLSRDLGEMKLSDLPPAAVSIVRPLPIGTISQPIRVSDGYILFMVCSRNDTADDVVREDIGNMLGTERMNRLQARYYRDLRAAAYVDIKPLD